MSAVAVIGANYGDEGKGLMTDYFASQFKGDCLVVRFNGGAQAGHTVQTILGRRHVFSHFGAGTFTGAATYLSREYVVNPMLFAKELIELRELGVDQADLSKKMFIDEECLVTTPYDICLNRAIENVRGANRHGSVGVGFGETIERSKYEEFRIRVRDLADLDSLRKKLEDLREIYVPFRLQQLGLDIGFDNAWILKSQNVSKLFKTQSRAMLDISVVCDSSIVYKFENQVFEGAQGLLLDQDYGMMPHVTRSNTGIKNIVELANEIDLTGIDVVYTTRSYLTRHGAGPMENEIDHFPYPSIIDETNKPGNFQGKLRFAYLDPLVLGRSIIDDMYKYSNKAIGEYMLAITCCDQIFGGITYHSDNKLVSTDIDEFAQKVIFWSRASGAYYTSYGPTRASVFKNCIRPAV